MDRINEAVKDFIARQGGNKKVIAERLGNITPQALGRYERGERTPNVEFFETVKKVYGEDLLNPRRIEPNGLEYSPEIQLVVSSFEKAIGAFSKATDAFNNALVSKDKESDWLRSYIDRLTVSGLTTAKKG